MAGDPLAKWLRESQSTGLGTVTSNVASDTSGLGYLTPPVVTPGLRDDYLKMQMLKILKV